MKTFTLFSIVACVVASVVADTIQLEPSEGILIPGPLAESLRFARSVYNGYASVPAFSAPSYSNSGVPSHVKSASSYSSLNGGAYSGSIAPTYSDETDSFYPDVVAPSYSEPPKSSYSSYLKSVEPFYTVPFNYLNSVPTMPPATSSHSEQADHLPSVKLSYAEPAAPSYSSYSKPIGPSYSSSSTFAYVPSRTPVYSYAPPKSTYSNQDGHVPAYTYQPESISSIPCPKNYLFSCQPSLAPVPCASRSASHSTAYSHYVPQYTLPEVKELY